MSSSQGGVNSLLDNENLNANSDFFRGYGEGIDGSWALRTGSLIPSNSEVEDYGWIGTSPQMSLWEGEALMQQLPNYKAALRNKEYLSGIKVSKADLRRDKTGVISQRIVGLGRNASRHWEKFTSDLMLAAETDGSATIDGSNDLSSQAFDGQAFFDTDHVFTGSNYTTAQSNDLSGGVFNVSTETAPTAEEAADIITHMVGQYWSFKDDQGEPINGDARNFMMMVGTVGLWAPLREAASSMSLASGQDNPVAGLRSEGVSIEVVLNPRLSAKTNKVYSFRTDGDIRPFILQEETPIELIEDAGTAFKKDIDFGAWSTRAVGYGLWTSAVLATLS